MLRSDQEPVLQDWLAKVRKRRSPAKTFHEVSLVGSSAADGVAERGVQLWLVEFAGTVVNGRTPCLHTHIIPS